MGIYGKLFKGFPIYVYVMWEDAVILSWGICYIACAFLKPDIGGAYFPFEGGAVLGLIGICLITPLILERLQGRLGRDALRVAKVMLFAMGCFEAVGVVTSWVGIVEWNVPSYGCQALYQVSMGFMDWVASIALFRKALSLDLGCENR